MLSREAGTAYTSQLQTNAQPISRRCLPAGSHERPRSARPTLQRRIERGRTGSANVPTSLLGIIGCTTTFRLNGSSTSKWGSSRLRSRSHSKHRVDGRRWQITALRARPRICWRSSSAAGTDVTFYVSIIPFSRDVSVDPRAKTSVETGSTGTDWAGAPLGSTPSMSVGPGDNCPIPQQHGFTSRRPPTTVDDQQDSVERNL